jgi:hypothetical protein
MMRHRRGTKTIRALKREVQYRLLVRGVFLGMKTTAIAKQLKLTSQTVRDWSAKPEAQAALDDPLIKRSLRERLGDELDLPE